MERGGVQSGVEGMKRRGHNLKRVRTVLDSRAVLSCSVPCHRRVNVVLASTTRIYVLETR